ncbi:single-stranded-DNA-specific exonuclease [Weissella uvarum]|uniref:single-stranded-DNA-specific exonuclease RecJ n=1 Tax=Weissella uvarum TaxID=1479233 RepID=UPI001960795A|nr:single-stranded-DNA-specific exonuclease RecJ [Weissella uvarum]MBM7617104.1 single-stranded-DNA-specific exonuclease [Weissella uvarum]MCM0595400.1 single-stranded-DNA-specific exonuclease RecJ [Weissella uvarum]
MIEAKYVWQTEQPQPAFTQELISDYGLPKLVARYVTRQGYQQPDEIERFLNPDVEQLHDPYQLHDLEQALGRIGLAIEQQEKIVVYGDYDVDGMTSTSIMVSALEILGANVTYFVPNRFEQGYGPNLEKYQELQAEGMQLLITVDNGVTGKEPIAWLKSQGIDTIVTDHHELPAELPDAYAIVHPRLPVEEPSYPFGDLSGAGVAFKVASALLDAPADELLDLAALGTVADVMPLTDENRVIVAGGLATMREDPRPGILALLGQAGQNYTELDANSIGFTIGPRLNAVGRLADPALGVQLLLAEDPAEAETLAEQVEQLNQQRQKMVDSITEQALQAVDPAHAVNVVMGTGWHEGVLGIVASRLVDATGKPSIVLSENEGTAKGSARSVDGFDLFTPLDAKREMFKAFGGHASAAGMTLPVDQVPELQKTLDQAAVDQDLANQAKPALMVLDTVDAADFKRDTFETMQVLAPFGNGNPEPNFKVNVTRVKQVKTMSNGKHIRFTAETDHGDLPVVGFGFGALAEQLQGHFQTIELVGTMSENVYRGMTTYQLMLKDLAANGSSIMDWRTSKLTNTVLQQNADYVFFNRKLYEQLAPQVGAKGRAIFIDDAFNYTQLRTMALVDLPDSLEQLSDLLKFVPAQAIAPIFYTKQSMYLLKVPDKSDFAKVFRFVQSFQNVDLSGQFRQVAQHLEMEPALLNLIFKVFLEAEFVTIENGFLNPVPNPNKVVLTETKPYKAFMARRELEKQLIYSSTAELEALLSDLSKQEN